MTDDDAAAEEARQAEAASQQARAREVREWLGTVGAVTTLVAAAGYVLGYVGVAFAAQRLGVSAHELGLTFADYLLLPLWAYLASLLTLGAYIVGMLGRNTRPIRSFFDARPKRAAAIVLVVIAVGLLVTLVVHAPFWAQAPVYVFIMINGANAAEFTPKSRMRLLSFLTILLLLGSALNTVTQSQSWAGDVQKYARGDGKQPIGWQTPGRSLAPRVGIASWQGHVACVVVLGDRVLVAKHGTLVVDGLAQFQPSECNVVDSFASSSTGAVEGNAPTTTTATATTSRPLPPTSTTSKR